jgi:hypothetical protein
MPQNKLPNRTAKSERESILANIPKRTRGVVLAILAIESVALGGLALLRGSVDSHDLFTAFVISIACMMAAVVIVFALELRSSQPGSNQLAQYSGEWRGKTIWKDNWAEKVWEFTPNHPRSEGEVCIYRTAINVYKGFSMWTVVNSGLPQGLAVAELSNFEVAPTGKLTSCSVKTKLRITNNPASVFKETPPYVWYFSEATATRLIGRVIAELEGEEVEVGKLILERVAYA